MTTHSVLIVVPTVNELLNLRELIPTAIEILPPNFSVLIVDDDSTDGTLEFIRTYPGYGSRLFILSRDSRLGIGKAHKDGILYAITNGYSLCATMDADGSHKLDDVRRAVNLFEELPDTEIVVGSRFIDFGGVDGWPIHRKVMTYGGHAMTKWALGTEIDTSSGLRVWRTSPSIKAIIDSTKSNDYRFLHESAQNANRLGVKIEEIPIRLSPRAYGSSKMSIKHIAKLILSLIFFRYS